VGAAGFAKTCRQAGVQIGSVGAPLAKGAIANDLALLTTDRAFEQAARSIPLALAGCLVRASRCPENCASVSTPHHRAQRPMVRAEPGPAVITSPSGK